MSDKLTMWGQELGLTENHWKDFMDFVSLYWSDYHGEFLLKWDNTAYNESSEQFEQRKNELLERKFLEWVEIMEIKKYNRIMGV